MNNDNNEKKPARELSLFELAQESREFLHDISNPLAIASGLVEAFRAETDRENLKLTEGQIRKLEKLTKALQRIEESIKRHRQRLTEAQSKT
jgi:hypothetical protein